jgi:hypothetical protein
MQLRSYVPLGDPAGQTLQGGFRVPYIISLQEQDDDRVESNSVLYGSKLVASSVSPTHSDHTKHPTQSVSATHYIITILCTPSAGNKPP